MEAWRRAIPRQDKVLTLGDHVCAKHFPPEQIKTHFEPVGTNVKIERDRPELHEDAVPCIFENTPKYLSSHTRKRKAPKERDPLPSKVKIYRERPSQWQDEEAPKNVEEEDEEMESDPPEMQVSSQPEDPMNGLKFPSSMWATCKSEDGSSVFYHHLNELRQVDKLVEYRPCGKTVSVFIRGGKVPFETEKVANKDEMEQLLFKVHKLKMCIGALPRKFSKVCSRYLTEQQCPKRMRGPVKESRCLACRNFRENEMKKAKREEQRKKRLAVFRKETSELKRKHKKLLKKVLMDN